MNPSTPSTLRSRPATKDGKTERPPSTQLRKTVFGGVLKLVLAATLLALAVVADATAQTYSVLHSFGVLTNVTGREPLAALAQAPDGTLYGTTSSGEGTVAGTVFKLNSDGTGFTVLKWFTNLLEGARPSGALVLSGSTLYGTTAGGGSFEYGTVFKVNTDGSGYTVLKNFTESEGVGPNGVTLSGSTLYGTTTQGGGSSRGTVFKINTNGSGYTLLKTFNGGDGAHPRAGLTLSGSTLYGTTESGGSSDSGTVFKVNTSGSGFTVLKNFPASDGYLQAGLTLSGSTLYGTTPQGGSSGYGTVFKVNTDGSGYIVLKNFTHSDGPPSPYGGLTLSGSTLFGTTDGTVFKINTDGSGYTVLKHFTLSSDGAYPAAGLTLSGSTLYGTMSYGGSSYAGTVFKVNTDGSGYTVLKHFTSSEDASPLAGVTLSGSTLYGTTEIGGSSNYGTVYQVNTDGSGYTVLKNFTGSDGAYPRAGVTLSGGTLYGTTSEGGSSASLPGFLGYGTVFKVNTNGSGYTVLKNFTWTNGAYPRAGLTLSGSTLYGTTAGTVFQVSTDGSGFTVLMNSTGSEGAPTGDLTLSGSTLYGTTGDHTVFVYGTVFQFNTDGGGYTVLKNFTGSDGAYPQAGVTLSGSTLYGTTSSGGSSFTGAPSRQGYGTVFKVNTDGSGYTVLKNFTWTNGVSNGAWPRAGVTLSGSTLYGTTYYGGSSGYGTVFQVNTDGSGYTVLKNFTGSDGAYPRAGVTLSGSTLYGTTSQGGIVGAGVVFSLSLQPLLTLALSGANVILTWPTNVTGFILQSTTNLVSSAWSTVSPAPVILNGQFTVTNPISGAQQFYRLKN